MKKILILIIIPDLKDEKHINMWNNSLKFVYSDSLNMNTVQSIFERWAIGYLYWNKLISLYENIDIYFIRTDKRLDGLYKIENNIITFKYEYNYGHIIYKTIMSMKLLQNKYDIIIRTNLNTIIDLDNLNKCIDKLEPNGIFTSPFWEGGNYPYGYFILISNDVANHIISHGLLDKWKYNDLPDDYEITQIILQKYNYYILDGCDKPMGPINNINKYGVKFNDNSESSNIIIDIIKKIPESVFLYRIKNISDNEYIKVYDYIYNHINKKIDKYKP